MTPKKPTRTQEAIALLKALPTKGGCVYCGTIWTSRPPCCTNAVRLAALLKGKR